jgi:hypothetical protein
MCGVGYEAEGAREPTSAKVNINSKINSRFDNQSNN